MLEFLLKLFGGYVIGHFAVLGFIWTLRNCVLYFLECKRIKSKIWSVQQAREKRVKCLRNELLLDGILVTEERERILGLPADTLVKQMKSGNLKASHVLQAFQAKALEVTERCNCVVEFLDEAKEWARALDGLPDKSAALFGLPVSIKEDMGLAGHNVTLGAGKFLGDLEQGDGALVHTLKKLGAIPFCRTNVPQLCLSTLNCFNPIYGLTTHPLDPRKSPGGSSGGEAALIASGGSVLGFGSDMTGSVRVPAHFCGIASLKPTYPRISFLGNARNLNGAIGLDVSSGIMARDVDTLVMASKGLFTSTYFHQFDPTSPPVLWNEELFQSRRKLRVGFFTDDDIVPETPSCQRALIKSLEVLKKAGHNIIDFNDIPKTELMRGILYSVRTIQDPAKSLYSHEPWDKSNFLLRIASHFPKRIQGFIMWATELGGRNLRKFLFFRGFSATDIWHHLMNKKKLTNDVVQRWKSLNLDVCLTCAYPFPAVEPKYWTPLFMSIFGVSICNLLNFPAGIVPVTTQNEEDTRLLKSHYGNGSIACKIIQAATSDSIGLPVGVQVVGLPWEEETVLRAMKELENCLKNEKEIREDEHVFQYFQLENERI